MKIYHSLQEFPKEGQSILVLGVFDGMHLGHQKLIDKALELKEKGGGQIVVCSFSPDINQICQGKGEKLVMTLDERIENLQDAGVDALILCEFTEEFKNTSAQDFIRQIQSAIDPAEVVVGFDYRFGKDALGEHALLEEGFAHTQVIDEVKCGQDKVSSSLLKRLISQGDFRSFAHLTGQVYVITGEVESGRGDGKKHNCPTANLALPKDKVLPPEGVYAVLVQVDDAFFAGVANLGVAPTFEDEEPKLEVHLIDFHQDIYQKTIHIFFYRYLRAGQKFDSTQELYEQVNKDIERTKLVIHNT